MFHFNLEMHALHFVEYLLAKAFIAVNILLQL